MIKTYNPDRPSPGARALRRHLYSIYGGDPVLMEQRDNTEVELFSITNRIEALQERADNLRREITGIDAGMREKTVPCKYTLLI